MLDIHLLGTGAMMPLPERRLASLLLRRNGRLLLIDCGEGTQVAIRESGWSMARIDTICLTHFHADHIAGLPGLLLTMGTCERKEPVTIIGPKGLEPVVRCLCVIAQELPFALRFEEIKGGRHDSMFHDVRLTGFLLDHVIPCYGYAFELDRPGKFDAEKAKELGIPIAHWSVLQKGFEVTDTAHEGRVFTPDMVMGAPRRGIKLAYCTDTRVTGSIVTHARDADLLICEGTYAESGKAEKARLHGHMTFAQAAACARDAGARELVLTHFSPAVMEPELFLDEASRVFPNVLVGRDLMHREFRFEGQKDSHNHVYNDIRFYAY